MAITLNGTTGITNDGAYTGDGVVFADGTPSNTLVTNTSGNVGIGTISPSQRLDIYQNSAAVVKIRGGSATNQGAGYYVWRSDNNGSLCAFGDYANQLGGTPDTLASIYTSNGTPLVFAVSATERMRIDSSGNLLVGTTNSNYGGATGIVFTNAGRFAQRSSANNQSIQNYYNASGGEVGYIYITSTATQYNTSSEHVS